MTISKIEEKRKEFLLLFIGIVVIDLLMFTMLLIFHHSIYFTVILCINIIGMLILPQKINEFKNLYYEYIMLASIQDTLSKFDYQQLQGMPYHKLYNSFALTDGENFKSTNHISGYYDELLFEQAHITISNMCNSYLEENRHSIVFQGEFLFFTLPKKYNTTLYIYQNNFRSMIKNSVIGKKYKNILSGSLEFNKKYQIRTNNEADAIKILDKIIPLIEEIRKKTEGKIMLCLKENRIYLAIDRCDTIIKYPSIMKKVKIKAQNYLEDIIKIVELTELD